MGRDISQGLVKRALFKTVLIKNRSLLFRVMENQGDKAIIQVIPCKLVICKKVLEYVLDLVLEAFKFGRNIAKKPYMEFLLRFFGRTQIRDVISLLEAYTAGIYWLVIFSRRGEAEGIYRSLLEEGIVEEVSPEECKASIDDIVAAYKFDMDKLLLQSEYRSEPLEKVLCKAVFEKISLSLTAK